MDLPTGWQRLSLHKICETTALVNPRKSPSSEFDYVDIASVSNKTFSIDNPKRMCGRDAPSRARKPIYTGDVIFATTRPYLKSIAKVPELFDKQVCSTGFCVLRPSARVLPDWLFFNAVSDDFVRQVTAKMRGGNYPAVSDSDVLAAEIPVPPIAEQHRILARLRDMIAHADELRTLRALSLKELDLLEPAVFADFLEGSRSDRHTVIPLRSILSGAQYGISQKASLDGHGVAILRMGNIRGGAVDTTDLKYIELPGHELEKYRLKDGDILFNRTNSLELVGKAATFQNLAGDWVFASYLVRLIVDRKKALPEFVTAVINSRIGREFVYRNASRAIGMVNINAKKIQGLMIPLPSLTLQQELVNRMQIARRLTAELHSEMDAKPIHDLLQSILRHAFSGEL